MKGNAYVATDRPPTINLIFKWVVVISMVSMATVDGLVIIMNARHAAYRLVAIHISLGGKTGLSDQRHFVLTVITISTSTHLANMSSPVHRRNRSMSIAMATPEHESSRNRVE